MSTHLSELPDRITESCYAENLATIAHFGGGNTPATIWTAWGTGISQRDYFVGALREILKRVDRSEIHWVHYSTLTREGHPRHPSRVSYGASFHSFDVHEYAKFFVIRLGMA